MSKCSNNELLQHTAELPLRRRQYSTWGGITTSDSSIREKAPRQSVQSLQQVGHHNHVLKNRNANLRSMGREVLSV